MRVKTVLAIDIGGTNFSVGIFRKSELIDKRTRPTNRAAGPEWLLDQMEEMVAELGLGSDFDSCGIGFGGPVDFAAQKVITSTHVGGWEGFGLVEEVVSRFRAPAIMDRDSMVGALGEGRYGAGKGYRPLFYITLSTGIGGGLLTDCGLFRGADSYACELGHHTIVPAGPACLCGSFGCLERMCSGLWMERDYGRPAEELFQDPEFLARYVGYLAQGLKNCRDVYQSCAHCDRRWHQQRGGPALRPAQRRARPSDAAMVEGESRRGSCAIGGRKRVVGSAGAGRKIPIGKPQSGRCANIFRVANPRHDG